MGCPETRTLLRRIRRGGGAIMGRLADLHLGQGQTTRQDTLTPTDQGYEPKTLADGVGHTFKFCEERFVSIGSPE